MKISARNILKGKIEKVDKGPVSSSIKIKLDSPETVTASITKEAVEDLGLKEGDEVFAVIKASEVMVAKK
jgi:molybdopterin-binding protein